MNIREEVNKLVALQDNITHLVENSPDLTANKLERDTHLRRLTFEISNRTVLANAIVEYVIVLEQRVELLEAAIVTHVRLQQGRIEPLEADRD